MNAKPRIRQRVSASIDQSADADDRNTVEQPNALRLQTVLWMVAQGRSQKAIAAHFDRDERTARRWIQHARHQGLAINSSLVPADIVADFAQQFLERKADLLDLKRAAEAAGDFAARIAVIRELTRTEVAFLAGLEKVGFFDGYRHVPKESPDSAGQSADRVKQATQLAAPERSHGVVRE